MTINDVVKSAKDRLNNIQNTLGLVKGDVQLPQIISKPQRLPLHKSAVSKPHLTPLNPVQFLLKSVMIYPQKLAIRDDRIGLNITYDQWGERVKGLAYALQLPQYGGCKLGDMESSRVAVLLYNTTAMLDAGFAVPAIGGIIVEINTRLRPEEIAYILKHSRSRVLIVDKELEATVADAVKKLNITTIVVADTGDSSDPYEVALQEGLKSDQQQGGKGYAGLFALQDEDRPFAICYTSGTTSRPKGVVTTFRGTYLAALGNVIESQLTVDSIYLWTLPMFHAGGWCFPWALTAVGATHVCLRKVDYDVIWYQLLQGGVTHYCAAPTVNISIVNHPKAHKLNRQVLVTVAGAAPTAHLIGQLRTLNLIPVHVYGLTETYGPTAKSYPQAFHKGLPIDVLAKLNARQGHGFITSDEVRVVDIDTMQDVPWDGETMGEIVFRGNIVMKEYLYDEAATKRAFKDGWFLAGDMAVRHPDGYLEIRDRSKDIIISGGENISTLELEAVLASHPRIIEVACVAKPHPKWGETPKAYVVLRGSEPTDNFQEELRAYAKTKTAGYKVPSEVEVVKELPKTSTGKIQKFVLRDRARNEAKK